jgi:hypothetical protein
MQYLAVQSYDFFILLLFYVIYNNESFKNYAFLVLSFGVFHRIFQVFTDFEYDRTFAY